MVTWNPLSKKEIEDAKTYYLKARKESRSIFDLDGKPITVFSSILGGFTIGESELKENELSVWLVNETGDELITWDINNPIQTKEAFEKFQKYLEKGWKAYCIHQDGSRSRRIRQFDSRAEEIIFDDQTTKQKLADFVKSFKKIDVLPRTFPG